MKRTSFAEEARRNNEISLYGKMVSLRPSVVLCGAPGVGKTYNVKKQLKAAGYNEGHNLCTIKGKCTPRVLYMTLMDYKDKNDIVLIDDADGLVGPGAPEDCINILKAALDSTFSNFAPGAFLTRKLFTLTSGNP